MSTLHTQPGIGGFSIVFKKKKTIENYDDGDDDDDGDDVEDDDDVIRAKPAPAERTFSPLSHGTKNTKMPTPMNNAIGTTRWNA